MVRLFRFVSVFQCFGKKPNRNKTETFRDEIQQLTHYQIQYFVPKLRNVQGKVVVLDGCGTKFSQTKQDKIGQITNYKRTPNNSLSRPNFVPQHLGNWQKYQNCKRKMRTCTFITNPKVMRYEIDTIPQKRIYRYTSKLATCLKNDLIFSYFLPLPISNSIFYSLFYSQTSKYTCFQRETPVL